MIVFLVTLTKITDLFCSTEWKQMSLFILFIQDSYYERVIDTISL